MLSEEEKGVKRDQISPSRDHPDAPLHSTLCCWHSHANSSPLVITLPLNQLTTTAGVRPLTAQCWMDGWRDLCACLCLYALLFVDGALILALLVLHKTAVIDDDTLSVLLLKQPT